MRQTALGVLLLSLSTTLVGAETPPKELGVRAVVQVTAMDLDVVATSGGKPVTDLGRDDPQGEPLAVGSKAPDFELDATGRRRIKLSALLRQGPAALFFYPGNNTPG